MDNSSGYCSRLYAYSPDTVLDCYIFEEDKDHMRTDVTKINEKSSHTELTEGLQIFAGGTSRHFHTGEWRTDTPVLHKDLCRQCLLCAPVCPDSSIPVRDGRRGEFDYDHCKGCGICASACPFGAIEMKKGMEA